MRALKIVNRVSAALAILGAATSASQFALALALWPVRGTEARVMETWGEITGLNADGSLATAMTLALVFGTAWFHTRDMLYIESRGDEEDR